MKESITINLPSWIKEKLDQAAKHVGIKQSDIVREALRQYFARQEFQRLRREFVPEGERRGIYTDEGVFREIS